MKLINYRKKNNRLGAILLFLALLAIFNILSAKLAAAAAQTATEPKWTNPFDNFEVKIPGMERLSDPVPCPDDPTKYCVKWLGEYTVGIYQYAIGIIGILAAIVIMIGGVIWLLAGGNSSKIGEAKKWIGGSIGGLVIALASYTILYQINPNLTIFKPLKITKVENKQPIIEGGCSWKTSCAEYEIQSPSDTACSAEDRPMHEIADTDTGDSINVNNSDYKCCCANLPANCNDPTWQKIFIGVAARKNIKKCILEATAKMEGYGNCKQRPERTNNGIDCGIMQTRYTNCGVSCEELENNPWKAVECAAQELNKCSASWRKSPINIRVKDYYAGYNGGCGALESSANCPGKKKWECPIKCGELCDVPRRTENFLKYYTDCENSL